MRKLTVTPEQYAEVITLALQITNDAMMRQFANLGIPLDWPAVTKWSLEDEKRYIEGLQKILGLDKMVMGGYELVVMEGKDG